MAQVTKNILQLVVQKIKSLFDKQQSQIDSIQAAVDNNSPLLVTYDGTSLSATRTDIENAINSNKIVLIADTTAGVDTPDIYLYQGYTGNNLLFTNVSLHSKYESLGIESESALYRVAEIDDSSVFSKKTSHDLDHGIVIHFKPSINDDGKDILVFATLKDYMFFIHGINTGIIATFFDVNGTYISVRDFREVLHIDMEQNCWVISINVSTLTLCSTYYNRALNLTSTSIVSYQIYLYPPEGYDLMSMFEEPSQVFDKLIYDLEITDTDTLDLKVFWVGAKVITPTSSTYTYSFVTGQNTTETVVADNLIHNNTYLIVPFSYKDYTESPLTTPTVCKCFKFNLTSLLPQAGSGITITKDTEGTPNTVNVKIPATEEYITADSTGVHTTEALRTALSSAGGSSSVSPFIIHAWGFTDSSDGSFGDLSATYGEISTAILEGRPLILFDLGTVTTDEIDRDLRPQKVATEYRYDMDDITYATLYFENYWHSYSITGSSVWRSGEKSYKS